MTLKVLMFEPINNNKKSPNYLLISVISVSHSFYDMHIISSSNIIKSNYCNPQRINMSNKKKKKN